MKAVFFKWEEDPQIWDQFKEIVRAKGMKVKIVLLKLIKQYIQDNQL